MFYEIKCEDYFGNVYTIKKRFSSIRYVFPYCKSNCLSVISVNKL